MCMEKSLWEQTVDFHEHECPGLATGFRIAEAAKNVLISDCECGCGCDTSNEMVAVVQKLTCSADAVQFVTGCTIGKKNFLIKDTGKRGYIFYLRNKGKAIRVTPKETKEELRKEIKTLQEKLNNNMAGEEEKDLLESKKKSLINEILSQPLEEACHVEEIDPNFHHKGHHYKNGMEACTCGCGCSTHYSKYECDCNTKPRFCECGCYCRGQARYYSCGCRCIAQIRCRCECSLQARHCGCRCYNTHACRCENMCFNLAHRYSCKCKCGTGVHYCTCGSGIQHHHHKCGCGSHIQDCGC